MKIWFAILLGVMTLNSVKAQLFSRESVDGALLGTFIGGAVGGGRHCGWSGSGAAIGAGIGFAVGAIASESCRERYYYSPYVYAPYCGYGYDYSYRPAYHVESQAQTATPAVRVVRRATWQTALVSAHKVPDAPRVPDAPTF